MSVQQECFRFAASDRGMAVATDGRGMIVRTSRARARRTTGGRVRSLIEPRGRVACGYVDYVRVSVAEPRGRLAGLAIGRDLQVSHQPCDATKAVHSVPTASTAEGTPALGP
jgi:hypothetical protein